MSKSNQNTRLASLKLAVKLADRTELAHDTADLVVGAATKFEEFVQAQQQVTLTGDIGLSIEPLRIALESNMNDTHENEHGHEGEICAECAKLNAALIAAGFPSMEDGIEVIGLNAANTAALIAFGADTFGMLLEVHPMVVFSLLDSDEQREVLVKFMEPVSEFLKVYHGKEGEGEQSDSLLNDPELESLASALAPAALNSKSKSTSGYGQLLLSDFSNLSSETTAFLATFGVRTVADFAYNPIAILKSMQLLPKPQTAKLLGHAITCMESDASENPEITPAQKAEISGRMESLRGLVTMLEMIGQMAAMLGEPEEQPAPAQVAQIIDPVKNARVKELLTHFGATTGDSGAVMIDIRTPEGAELIALMRDPHSGFEAEQVGEPREYASREEAQAAAAELVTQHKAQRDPGRSPLIQAIAAMLSRNGKGGKTLH